MAGREDRSRLTRRTADGTPAATVAATASATGRRRRTDRLPRPDSDTITQRDRERNPLPAHSAEFGFKPVAPPRRTMMRRLSVLVLAGRRSSAAPQRG
jgi:hypothetical protein